MRKWLDRQCSLSAHNGLMTLEEWMHLKGLKDAELAAEINARFGDKTISRSQISRLRRRKSPASRKTAEALAEVTKLPAAMFVFGQAA